MNQGNIWLFLLVCLVYNCAVWFVYKLPRVKKEQKPNKLVIYIRPTLAWNIGAGFGGGGLVFLVYSRQMNWFIVVFLSFLIMALSPLITCRFDKESNRMTIKRQTLFGKKTFKHLINEISDVNVEHSSTDDEGSFYRVTLTLSSGDNIPLTRSYTSDFEEQQRIAELINNFLNLGR